MTHRRTRAAQLVLLLGVAAVALPSPADAAKPRCRGKKATIVGTKGADRMRAPSART